LYLFPVLLVAKTALFLQTLKLPCHVDLGHQAQDALGETLAHQFICEPRGQGHKLSTKGQQTRHPISQLNTNNHSFSLSKVNVFEPAGL
jgi:hypothetical protein